MELAGEAVREGERGMGQGVLDGPVGVVALLRQRGGRGVEGLDHDALVVGELEGGDDLQLVHLAVPVGVSAGGRGSGVLAGEGGLWAWAASAPPGCRVLELGAGTGRGTAFLAHTAGRIAALELAPEMIAVARRKLAGLSNVWFVAADMREIPLRSSFDLVAAI